MIAFPDAPADNDRDGFNVTLDCNDANAAIRPGAIEILGNNVDENCDKIASPARTMSPGPMRFVKREHTTPL